MKKFLLAALVLVGSGAFAHPRTVYNVRLRVDTQPMHATIGGGELRRGVLLNSEGEVIYFESSVAQPLQTKHVVVARLSAKEVEEIDAQIELARQGKIEDVVEFCEAIPTTYFDYTADNGSVKLLNGSAPCGGRMENQSEEAKALVDFLQKFLRARN